MGPRVEGESKFQNPTRRRLEGEGPSTLTTKVAKTFLVLLNVSWWSRLLRACYKRQETGSFRILAEIMRKLQFDTPVTRIWLHVKKMDSEVSVFTPAKPKGGTLHTLCPPPNWTKIGGEQETERIFHRFFLTVRFCSILEIS